MAEDLNKMEEQEEMTVTLTLEDDTELECIVLTIFQAGDRDYIALLPMEGQKQKKEKYSCTVTARQRTELQIWKTSKTMMSTKSLQTHLTSFWMKKSTTKS